MTPEQRTKAIEALAQKWADDIDLDDLLDYYITNEEADLQKRSDDEILEYLAEEDIELEADLAN
jgi:hypothetical protein